MSRGTHGDMSTTPRSPQPPHAAVPAELCAGPGASERAPA